MALTDEELDQLWRDGMPLRIEQFEGLVNQAKEANQLRAKLESRLEATDLPCLHCGAAEGEDCRGEQHDQIEDNWTCVGMSGGYEVHRIRANAYYDRALRRLSET